MSKTQLKKHLESLDKSKIITMILNLYDSHKEVKEYFEYQLNPNEEASFLKYKQIIENEYYPERGEPKTRLAVAKKAIADFSKLKPSPVFEAELLIFLVEMGCQFTHDYGDMWEGFYDSMVTNFDRALKFMAGNDLLDRFRFNAELCLKYSSPCGYNFPAEMEEVFYEYYGE